MTARVARDTPNQPKISVVTPSLNQGRFLRDALQSVVDQNYPRVEHIVVEGGSQDDSIEVLSKYAHYGHVCLIEAVPPRGQSHAVNVGFRAATGDVFGWLNADDRYCPGAFAEAVAALADSDADLVYGSWEIIDEHGRFLWAYKAGPFDLDQFLNGVNVSIAQPAVFFRRSLLERTGYLDETLHYVMDFDFLLRAARVTAFGRVDATLAQFRHHSNSKTIAQTRRFYPEGRRVARRHGGPFFSTAFRRHYLSPLSPRYWLPVKAKKLLRRFRR
jgi:glycosyltransferase involved in cell wall biosynthesis